jgi:hypothetical protein
MSPRSGSPRMLPAVLVATVTTAFLVAGCTAPTASREPSSTPASPSAPTAAQRPDLTGLSVPRAALCEALPEDAVTEALDGPVADTAHYLNGDEFEVRPGYVDVAHEYGCVYTGADGTTAKVWVFARPVQRHEARMLVRRARQRRDCAFPQALTFGRPGLTSVCEISAAKGTPRLVRARFEGLFGDSWVGCEVSEPMDRPGSAGGAHPRRDVLQRADAWCVDVVTTVGTRS